MRLPRVALALIAAFSALPGCYVPDSDVTPSPAPVPTVEGPAPAPPPAAPPKQTQNKDLPNAPAVDESVFAEEVYVFMKSRLGQYWMCTGTLVDERTVVTAAHCLDTQFVSFQIVAPLAPGKPRVSASKPRVLGGSYEDVANPDIGTLTLDTAIVLPRYAELTDVVSRVEGGEALQAAAVVRTDEQAESPLVKTDAMPLSSTVELGYAHGFATPLFSKGGDSGAGLFLVEDGKMTHKLIGVARQPDPDTNLDHFTRIDAEFLAFFAGGH